MTGFLISFCLKQHAAPHKTSWDKNKRNAVSLFLSAMLTLVFVLQRFLLLEWWTGFQRVMTWYIISGCLQIQTGCASLLEIIALRYMIGHIHLNEGPMYLAVWRSRMRHFSRVSLNYLLIQCFIFWLAAVSDPACSCLWLFSVLCRYVQ